MPKFDNIPDTGKYEFEEQLEVHEEAKERLESIKLGIMWYKSLTPKQINIYELRQKGLSYGEIAKIYKISKKVVIVHLQRTYTKLSKILFGKDYKKYIITEKKINL